MDGPEHIEYMSLICNSGEQFLLFVANTPSSRICAGGVVLSSPTLGREGIFCGKDTTYRVGGAR